MKRYEIVLILLLTLSFFTTRGQYKYEREYRIKKSQFPSRALSFIEEEIQNARKLRFYRETDSTRVSYEAKFKLDRLHYSVEFNQKGDLEDIEILIKEVDIPNESMVLIKDYLKNNFAKYRILRIQQQYPVTEEEPVQQTKRNAFQNLLLPTIRYEIMVAAKKEDGFQDYEILFDADGNFIKLRKSLPANYDHVLY